MAARAFGHYEIVESLGAGGMGAVYRARDTRLGREVAIKVLRQDAAWTAAARERLMREARTISKLNHPNICAVHDIGERDGETFIVMELVPGTPLTHRLATDGLDPETVARWGAQLADALEHAHQHGIIHRDVKPSNVVVTPAGNVKLVDFGIAARGPGAPDDTTMFEPTDATAGAVAGTPPYMAPEVMRGGMADARSDIWSLGVLLHESLAGTRPFDGQTREEITRAILREAPTPLPGHVPPEFGGILKRCLAKDPGARYQRAGEVRAALEAVQPVPRSGFGRWGIRAGAGGVVALAAVAALLALADWLPGRGGQSAGARRVLESTPEIRGVAVLPLRNLGGGEARNFFADGMTAALITELAKVESLKVISQTSVMRYRDRADRTLPQIGAELGVDAIVEGTVLHAGDRVRISVELLHASSDRHLWAESYEQPMSDVLTLQSDIARAVVAHVQSRVSQGVERPERQAAQVHPEAYELFLHGEFSVAQGTPTGVDRAVGYYERALALDPDFAPAHAGLAGAWFAQEFWGTAPFQSNADKVRASVAKALSFDPNLADALVMKARVQLNYDWDWAGAEASLKRAIELSPGLPFAHETRCWLLLPQGRRDEALAAARKAATLDPQSAYMVNVEGRVLHAARRYKEAEAAYERALNLDPGFPIPYAGLALLYMTERRFAEAKEMMDRRDRLPSARPDLRLRAWLEAATGSKARALGLLKKIGPTGSARVHVVLGDYDAAFAALNEAIDDRTLNLVRLTDPEFDPVRSDPRFARAVERTGLSAAPLVAWGKWPEGR
jgi:TolB-like protein/tetratricopeptide (TPR) repeat protein/predicted Ser/Thr protein kinase